MELFKKILIPLTDRVQVVPYFKLAAALLPPDGKILALGVVRVPEENSLSEGAEEALRFRATLEECKAQFPDKRVELKTLVRVTHRLSEGIAETVKEESCDFLLLPWKGYAASQEHLFGATIDRLLDQPPCAMAVVRLDGFAECRNILLPVRGGPYAEFALAVTSSLAQSLGAEVTVLHCEATFVGTEFEDFPYRSFLHKLRLHPQVRRLLTVQGDPKHAIVEEAKRHDMVVVGAVSSMEPRSSFLGPVVERIASQSQKPLLVIKTPDSVQPWLWPQSDLASRPKSLSERVDKWFAENTFHRSEFNDLQKLVDLKLKQRLTVSLGLPALNEAETVGNIISTIKTDLVDEVPLLDEIVLIDSRSTDDTVAIARDLGIEVYVHQDILPQYGAKRGKGEGLWKSLHVLKGDLILWIDTDIKNIHSGFVYGILGPLLADPEVQYVKGFYRRPIAVGDKTFAEGGGRVTELTARPLFNLFFPELSGIIQPLAGEYGGRRTVLERVPFFVGYGVETGLLIDLFSQFGLQAIAQVDLEERIHRNQPLPALSQMAFAIIQVFIQRLEEKNRIKLMEEINQSMKLIRDKGTTYALELKDIRDQERPPMISIPEYNARRQQLSATGGAARI
ncbi:MAG TPA: glucosyl-3-phosphoglycerate synthase [Candidatus Binatia bacterium]|nr:glucosyl-3-phosphoglycerate synthase [Candidatus Binatia bacterium]